MGLQTPKWFQDRGVAHRLQGRQLIIAVNLVAGLSIFFFGYDQGVMSGVNTSRNYTKLMNYGYYDSTTGIVEVTKPLLQGGIVAVYYLPGTLVGALWGGWLGDRYGRISAIGFASIWAIIGACLQCSSQNASWMFCARVFNGIGTGILNAITPVWSTETASHTSRGMFVAFEFTLNILGVVFAYWIEYGTSFYGDGTSGFIWRFPIAFQILPLIGLFLIIWWMPESPRWLVKSGRKEEALFVLRRLRDDEALAAAEYEDIQKVIELERDNSQSISHFAMFFGIKQGKLHTARRIQLVIWLQILQEWIGIAGVTIYGPTIFTLAGVSAANREWVSGLNDVTYMLATLICVFTIDRIGRRWTLYWGAVGQGICCFCAGGLAYATKHATVGSSYRTHTGGAAVFFVYLYTAIFGATWLTVPWLYPAEIFPLQIRAKGNAWGVVGWSIGNGWCTLLLPTIFDALGPSTLYIFGGVNVLSILVVWAFYPETNQRTLEEMDLVFAADSIFNWEAERNFKLLAEQNPELVHAARRGHGLVADVEDGSERRRSHSEGDEDKVDDEDRRPSLVVKG